MLAFAGVVGIEREAVVIRTVQACLALRQTPLRVRVTLRREPAALASVLDQVREWIEPERE